MSVVRDDDHSDGEATIEGTGIRVQDVASAYLDSGYDPEEITDLYPDLGLAEIHAALAYYYDHPEEFGSSRHAEA